jgi:hypothetical protein
LLKKLLRIYDKSDFITTAIVIISIFALFSEKITAVAKVYDVKLAVTDLLEKPSL